MGKHKASPCERSDEETIWDYETRLWKKDNDRRYSAKDSRDQSNEKIEKMVKNRWYKKIKVTQE